MRASRPTLARLTWFVSFAILLAALLPSLSHAFASQQPGGFGGICSATGARYLPTQTGSDDGKSSSNGMGMSCPYCAIHHGAPSLPPSAVVWAPSPALQFERPFLFLQAPRPLFAWAPALARAPPHIG